MSTIKPAYLDAKSAAAYVALSLRTFMRYVQSGLIPKPRQLAGQRVGWLVRELDAWCESRPVSQNLPVANCGMRKAV